jgi:very-short-patch-repair endonuclease
MIPTIKSYQKVNRTCKYCGKKFRTYYRFVKKGLGIYCSVKCCNTYKNKFIIKNKIAGKLIKCKLCNKKFWITPSLEKRNIKCCSEKCSLEYRKKHEKKTKCICKLCKKFFKIKNSHIARKNKPAGKYCSKKCMDKHRQRRKTIKCKKCRKHFWVHKGSKTPKIFCSKSCHIKYGASSSLETIIAKDLKNIKCKFIRQKFIRLGKRWTHPDFFISPNICLYVDGVYWHSFKDAQIRDTKNNIALRNRGYRVFRIKDTTMKNGRQAYIQKLIKIKNIQQPFI